MKHIVYVADIDQDIDDVIAIDYLNHINVLKYVVLDTEPITELAKERIKILQSKGIAFKEFIEDGEEILFVGGSLKKVAVFLKKRTENCIKFLVMNGGFVGNNIVENDKQLEKFKNQKFMRTYNFNLDVKSTEYVLTSEKVNRIYLIGKNVCHSEKNTKSGIWKKFEFLSKYEIGNKKRLHDLLMVVEGLILIEENNNESNLCYKKIKIVKMNEEADDNTVKWGSELAEESNTFAAVNWKI